MLSAKAKQILRAARVAEIKFAVLQRQPWLRHRVPVRLVIPPHQIGPLVLGEKEVLPPFPPANL